MIEARTRYVSWFEELGSGDVERVGGKNASLGEMVRSLAGKGIRVPDGFAVTADAYWVLLESNGLAGKIESQLSDLKAGARALSEVGRNIRRLFLRAGFPPELQEGIKQAYRELCLRCGVDEVSVAVRSSATAEDLPDASFAGQQETFLNMVGEQEVLDACRRCYASLFTNRAISYREAKGFDHLKVALSIGVQRMVRSDKGSSGVMFTIDPESGFKDVVVINAAWGLGETVVQGIVNPDEYVMFKPLRDDPALTPIIMTRIGKKEVKIVFANGNGHGERTTRKVPTRRAEREAAVLTEKDVLQLARWACEIEEHYGKPMDIEWAGDGETGELFIVQARPETVQSRKLDSTLKTYRLKETGKRLASGLSIGEAIASGRAQVIKSTADMDRFEDGAILVTEMTDPDWVPVMKRAAGIVTDLGGRTSHAAIVSRELGVTAVVGTGDATERVADGQGVTISCAEGDHGHVYDGILDFEVTDLDLQDIPETRTQIMLNIASPSGAFRWWRLPVKGIGLARVEFIISDEIRVHPMALVRFNELTDAAAREQIEALTRGYSDKSVYFVDLLAQGIARIATSRHPYPVIVRMSDFKSNEYGNLIGGKQFELAEENPILGLRGASRYYSERYRDAFALECRAVKRVRERMGLTNVIVMIPFCRTPEEAERVLEVMAANGLRRGERGLQVYAMAEIPSNVILAEEFACYFDGFSIGSNDLTQLVLGVDRDSAGLAYLFDERHQAVKKAVADLIAAAHRAGRKVGICGQAPSDYPDFAAFLVDAGIDSISLNPDSVVPVKRLVAERENELLLSSALPQMRCGSAGDGAR